MTVAVHQIGDLLKCEKTDRQRQYQMQQRDFGVEEKVGVADKKVGVFEVSQQCQIGTDTDHEQVFWSVWP